MPAPRILALVGLLVALLSIGIAVAPVAVLPVDVALRLDRNRQTIALTGVSIGVACVLIGLLNGVSGG